MKKTVAPLASRIFAIVSLALGFLWAVGYVVSIVFQRDFRIMMNYPEEVIDRWILPMAPLLVNGLVVLLQSVAAVLLLAFWNKPVWARGAAIAAITVEAVFAALMGPIGSFASAAESVMVGQYQGYSALAAMSSVSQSLSFVSGFFSMSVLCMRIALSLLAYRAGLDRKLEKTGGVLV